MAGMEGSGREQARALEGDSRAVARAILVRLKRMDPEKIQRRSGILYARLRKWVRRRRTRHPDVSNFPVFIAGSNRSGTQMVSRALGDSPHGWDYPETNSAAFDDLHH